LAIHPLNRFPQIKMRRSCLSSVVVVFLSQDFMFYFRFSIIFQIKETEIKYPESSFIICFREGVVFLLLLLLDLTWFLTGRNSISPKAGKLLFSLITWSDILIYAQHKFIKVALMIGWQQLLMSSVCFPYFSVYKVFRTFNSNPKSILINSWWWFCHRWSSDDKKNQ